MRVMIVEDDPLVAEGIAACVELLGHEAVGIVYSGLDALEEAAKLSPDVVLMDIRLPDISGIEVVKRLEEKFIVPCIFITAFSDKKLIEEARGIKTIYGYLVKPVNEQELKATLDIAVTRFREKLELKDDLEKTQKSLSDRKLIERAKGILMDSFGMKEQQAMDALQKKSKDNNRRLADVAKDVISFFGT